MTSKVYDYVLERILEKLDQGVIPWRKPWSTNGGYIPKNYVTGREYSGINILLLDPGGQYLTFNQVQQKGGRIQKGEKASMVVFWKMLDSKEQREDGELEEKKIPFLRYYNVWEISQTTLKRKQDDTPILPAERILEDEKIPRIQYGGERAFYNPAEDYINLPERKSFNSREEFYSTAFHEVIHSTGHKDRLKRLMSTEYGNSEYAFEELIAEIGSAFLCHRTGILQPVEKNTVAYCQHWAGVLRDNKKAIVQASGKAQKAVTWLIQGVEEETEEMEEVA